MWASRAHVLCGSKHCPIVLVRGFHFCDKTHDPKIEGKKELIQPPLPFHSQSSKELRARTQAGQGLEARTMKRLWKETVSVLFFFISLVVFFFF